MNIIVQSSAFLPTPAKGAGAVEYLVAKLAEGLASRGHRVRLACLEGSQVDLPRLEIPAKGSAQAREAALASIIAEASVESWPDVIFDHSLTQTTQRVMDVPAVTMSHGMAPISPWARNIVFTSEHHGRLHGFKGPVALHNGIDVDEVPFVAKGRTGTLLWAGRFLPYKHPEKAIQVIGETDRHLNLCGPPISGEFWRQLEGYLDKVPRAHLVGEVDHADLLWAMGLAPALLFTSDEQEPAGIVMLEAQAAGTPVLAFDHGANREYTDTPLSGLLVKSESQMVDAIKDRFWETIKPEDCRAYVQVCRSIRAMVAKAEKLLARAAQGERW